ncbi:MAG TPA: glycosyltransferase family 2 protein [Spirochaetota bacterium]|nr:glycosyltransferase family 2 protein [Spirochaetota bacterium]
MNLSVIIPCYNEAENLPLLLTKLTAVIKKYPKYEIILIDDGSTDRTEETVCGLLPSFSNIKYLQCRRNFGKANALNIGFKSAQGDIVITMDGDLQDDPAEIPAMVTRLTEGYDMISGWKKKRQDPLHKTLPSLFFNFITSLVSGIRIHDFNCGFKAYSKAVTESIDLYGELHRYIPVLAWWKGFKVTEMPVTHHKRKHGRSKYGPERFSRGLFDFMTVYFLTRFKAKPLHFFGKIGLLSGITGTMILTWLSVKWFMGQPINSRPLFFLGLLILMLGVVFFLFGFLGEMIIHLNQNTGIEPYMLKNRHASPSQDLK